MRRELCAGAGRPVRWEPIPAYAERPSQQSHSWRVVRIGVGHRRFGWVGEPLRLCAVLHGGLLEEGARHVHGRNRFCKTLQARRASGKGSAGTVLPCPSLAPGPPTPPPPSFPAPIRYTSAGRGTPRRSTSWHQRWRKAEVLADAALALGAHRRHAPTAPARWQRLWFRRRRAERAAGA